jgi:hypothetical protein
MSNHEREDLREAGQDAALERAWRDGSTELPSARVDAAILAAAHEAVANPHQATSATAAKGQARSRWNRWAPMAAAAAVAGLAFTLVQTLPREPARTPPPAARESAAAAAQGSATPVAPEVAPTLAPAQAGSAERQEKAAPSGSVGDSLSVPLTVPPPAVSAAPQLLPAEAIEERSSFEERGNVSAARSKAVDAAVSDGMVNVDDWVQRIVALHAAGDIVAATDALRAFRAAEPDADRHLPQSLWDWAESVH